MKFKSERMDMIFEYNGECYEDSPPLEFFVDSPEEGKCIGCAFEGLPFNQGCSQQAETSMGCTIHNIIWVKVKND